MLKYVSKIAMDILPSVAATIIGAYIVNHYITAKPAPDAPAAAAVSSVSPKKVDLKSDAKALEPASDTASLPEAGVRAKGISEKAIIEKSTAEKPAEKSADKPAETASIPADTRRRPSTPREKTAAKVSPAPVQPSGPAVVPVVASPDVTATNPAPPVEAAVAPEEHFNANDLARATLERLRGTNDNPPHAQEAVRIPDPPRVVSTPPASAPTVRPLPPPIMVSTPSGGKFGSAPDSTQKNAASEASDDPSRPTPPADIPVAPPLDLRAEATEPPPAREHTNVAEDMLSAAKSVFHAVLPK
jgi:hypothetical protein